MSYIIIHPNGEVVLSVFKGYYKTVPYRYKFLAKNILVYMLKSLEKIIKQPVLELKNIPL